MKRLLTYCQTCKTGFEESWLFNPETTKKIEKSAQDHINSNPDHYVQMLIIDDSWRVSPSKEGQE